MYYKFNTVDGDFYCLEIKGKMKEYFTGMECEISSDYINLEENYEKYCELKEEFTRHKLYIKAENTIISYTALKFSNPRIEPYIIDILNPDYAAYAQYIYHQDRYLKIDADDFYEGVNNLKHKYNGLDNTASEILKRIEKRKEIYKKLHHEVPIQKKIEK